jgi:hypothetical protein
VMLEFPEDPDLAGHRGMIIRAYWALRTG